MKHYLYTTGAVALALAMSGLPAVAVAEKNGGDDARVQVAIASTSTTTVVSGQKPSIVGGEKEEDNEGSSTEGVESLKHNIEKAFESAKEARHFEREDSAEQEFSAEGLKQSIEKRQHELEQEVASTTPEEQDIVKNANPVRLAVHSLLASKDLLGGIGQEVSQIAHEMNDSVATTTDAEIKIQSRGFLSRLFFGGDKQSADAINQAIARDQQNIQKLTDLLNQANITAEVKATLETQITAVKDAQARLQTLAQDEQKLWGLFSWRF